MREEIHTPPIDTLKWEGRWLADDGEIACGKQHITANENGRFWQPITQDMIDLWYDEMTADLMHPESGIHKDADDLSMGLKDYVELMAAIRCDQCGERLETQQ